MNIALIGMMGTMKTSVGKALAAATGMAFADSDEEFVREEGTTIAATFAERGEDYFRVRETDIVKRLASRVDTVISCGGGVPLKRENVEALRATATVVLLTASPERIFERTSCDDTRPLLCGGGLERIKSLCAERQPFYESAADFTVDTTDLLPGEAAELIVEKCITRDA